MFLRYLDSQIGVESLTGVSLKFICEVTDGVRNKIMTLLASGKNLVCFAENPEA